METAVICEPLADLQPTGFAVGYPPSRYAARTLRFAGSFALLLDIMTIPAANT